MSEMISLTINDMPVEAEKGSTILGVARAHNIYIPTLCHHPHLTHFGACRLCLVEVAGTERLLPSCTTIIAEDMEIRTDTPRLNGIRRTLVELLLMHHPLDCLVCDKGGECELQNIAFNLQVTENSLGFQPPLPEPPDHTNFLIQRDMQKCMLCGKCVRVCDEVRNVGALGFSHHGLVASIGYPEKKLANCEFCGQCLAVCPVGALSSQSAYEARPWQMEPVTSICPYCGCGCSFNLQRKEDKIVKVTSDEKLGGNEGLLCVKGRFGFDFIHHPTRLNKPLLKKGDSFVEVSWEEAIQTVANELKRIKQEKGSDAVAGIASTRCTNEENYLFQKLMRVALGTNNIDNYARLEHAPSIKALSKTLGIPAATNSIMEVRESQAILVVGANPTSSHILMGLAIKQAVRNFGSNLIIVDPARNKLVPFAKSWVRIKPGTDVAFLNGMAKVIIDEDLADKEFIEQCTAGYSELVKKLVDYSPEKTAKLCGIKVDSLKEAARTFALAETASIVYGDGLTQQGRGEDNVYALLNLLLLTGNLGRKGTGIHPLRISCNVQGACDMGALPDYLPGYQSLDDEAARRILESIWESKLSPSPGLNLVEMIEAACEGKLSAMYIMGENPILAFPKRERVEEALKNLDFLVVQDIFLTETAQLADVVLPAASFAEKQGTFTSTERRVQKITPAVKAPGESKPDWQIIQKVANAMGCSFNYASPAKIMEEISQLVPNYAGVRYQGIGRKGLQWPLNAEGKGTSFIKDFPAKLKFTPVDYKQKEKQDNLPYVLLSGSTIFHHLSGTMTGRTRGLAALSPDVTLEMNPVDADKLDVKEGDEVALDNECGEITAKVKISEHYPVGIVFLPKHSSSVPVNLITGYKLGKDVQTPANKVTLVKINQAVK